MTGDGTDLGVVGDAAILSAPGPEPKLTDKQRIFVAEYLVDLNGTQAAIRAGYSHASARQIASENLSKPDIAEAIDRALTERSGVTRTRIVDELAAIGFADIRKVVSWRPELAAVDMAGEETEGAAQVLQSRVLVIDSAEIDPDTARAIAEVSQGATGALRIKMHDKSAALEKLARTLGMFKDRMEIVGKNGGPVQMIDLSNATDEQLAALEALFGPVARSSGDAGGDPGGTGTAPA